MTTAAIQEFFKENSKLPSPPAIALKILDAIRQDENTFEDLAQIIMADPALTAQILRIANSSLYGFPNPVESLSQATALIGFNALKNIALSFVIVQDLHNGLQGSAADLDLFWKRSVTAAVAAETLAETIGMRDSDLFVSALLQDLGVLLMYLSDPVSYTALKDEKRVHYMPICEAEQQQFGFDHTEIGSHLLTAWGLPDTICQPIRSHHAKETNGKHGASAQVLQLADKISAIYHGMHSNRKAVEVHRSLAELYQLSEEQTSQLIDVVGEKAQEILELFELDPGDLKPFSLIMQEANEELGRLNFSYAQIVLELKQAKQSAEQLAIELKLANESLRRLAFRDGLTGLYNHRYFQEILESEIGRAVRYKHQISLIMVDIDYFKNVNDQFGHPAGDKVLQEVGDMLRKLVRRCDIVSRYGGEEFAIILPETGTAGAKILAQRVRRGVERMEIKYGEQLIKVTISCGLTCSDGDSSDISRAAFISSSDQALYRAKKNGRNRVEM